MAYSVGMEALRDYRRRHNLTYAQLAALMGVAPRFCEQMAAGRRPVSDTRILALPDGPLRAALILGRVEEYSERIGTLQLGGPSLTPGVVNDGP